MGAVSRVLTLGAPLLSQTNAALQRVTEQATDASVVDSDRHNLEVF